MSLDERRPLRQIHAGGNVLPIHGLELSGVLQLDHRRQQLDFQPCQVAQARGGRRIVRPGAAGRQVLDCRDAFLQRRMGVVGVRLPGLQLFVELPVDELRHPAGLDEPLKAFGEERSEPGVQHRRAFLEQVGLKRRGNPMDCPQAAASLSVKAWKGGSGLYSVAQTDVLYPSSQGMPAGGLVRFDPVEAFVGTSCGGGY